MNTPKIQNIVESCLYVEDLEKSFEFYNDLFGFEKEIHDEFICVLRASDQQALILFPKKIADQPARTSSPAGVVEGQIPAHGGNGRMHIGFAIAEDDKDQWSSRLKQRGIQIDGTITWNRGGTSIYFRDIDDHLVELITPGLWSFY